MGKPTSDQHLHRKVYPPSNIIPLVPLVQWGIKCNMFQHDIANLLEVLEMRFLSHLLNISIAPGWVPLYVVISLPEVGIL